MFISLCGSQTRATCSPGFTAKSLLTIRLALRATSMLLGFNYAPCGKRRLIPSTHTAQTRGVIFSCFSFLDPQYLVLNYAHSCSYMIPSSLSLVMSSGVY
jgi:hypothetical protein